MYKKDTEGLAKRDNDFKKHIYLNSLKKGFGDRKLILCDIRDTDT